MFSTKLVEWVMKVTRYTLHPVNSKGIWLFLFLLSIK